jgi:hypothetical protein
MPVNTVILTNIKDTDTKAGFRSRRFKLNLSGAAGSGAEGVVTVGRFTDKDTRIRQILIVQNSLEGATISDDPENINLSFQFQNEEEITDSQTLETVMDDEGVEMDANFKLKVATGQNIIQLKIDGGDIKGKADVIVFYFLP